MCRRLSGSFDFVIDPTDTDVSIRYDVGLDTENMTNDNLIITSISEIEEGNTLIRTDENTYTGILALSDIQDNVTNTIRVSVQWIDNPNNNSQDISMGANGDPVMRIPITVHAIQYLGETITPYVEPQNP